MVHDGWNENLYHAGLRTFTTQPALGEAAMMTGQSPHRLKILDLNDQRTIEIVQKIITSRNLRSDVRISSSDIIAQIAQVKTDTTAVIVYFRRGTKYHLTLYGLATPEVCMGSVSGDNPYGFALDMGEAFTYGATARFAIVNGTSELHPYQLFEYVIPPHK